MNNSAQKYTRGVAISMVIANMIGTGVFTSLGYQVGSLPSGFVILFLWFLGGVIALSGALSYAEISTRIGGSGGEYNYLSKIYHPAFGFVAGWMSLIVGFAAPICAVSLAIGGYFSPVTGGVDKRIIAVVAIVLLSLVHVTGVRSGGKFQNVLTWYKLILILFFCLIPFLITGYEPSGISFLPVGSDWDLIFSSGFAVSLAFINYAFSGWNASTYIAGVLEEPKKNLPFSLITGTLVVTVLYMGLNAVFLYVGNFEELGVKPPNYDEVDVGNVVAFKLFGSGIGKIFAALITFALVSSLSAMVIAGPRVLEQMGNDYKVFQGVSRKTKGGAPLLAISLQAILAISMVMISSFESMIRYISVSLTLFSLFTVAGVFILRLREKKGDFFRTPGYPLTPLVFIAANSWMFYYMTKEDPMIILASIFTMVPGLLIYFFVKQAASKNS